MPFISGDIVVEEIDATFWKLREAVVYQGAIDRFTVAAGFVTDFASVPRALVWLIPRYGNFTCAAILHDYLCQSAVVTRADADGIFRRALNELGVSVPRRWMMWAAVRLGSGMRGASLPDWLLFLAIAIPSVAFVAIPVVVVSIFGGAFWMLELCFWAVARVANRTDDPPPTSHIRLA